MELSPEFIKVDRAFIAGIDEDPARQELLRALHREGRTLICVTHSEEVAAAAGRVVRIRDGGIDNSGQLLSALKPIALEAAAVIFAQEIQRALEQMLHEGRLATVTSGRGDEDDEKPPE